MVPLLYYFFYKYLYDVNYRTGTLHMRYVYDEKANVLLWEYETCVYSNPFKYIHVLLSSARIT